MNPRSFSGTPGTRIILLILLLTGLILPAAAITVTDDAGAVVTLNATPRRIVSLAPSSTEILAALGLTGRIAGVTDVCNYPPEVQNITHIGSYSSLSIEKIAASRPDLVVASDITPQETVNRLRALGLIVVVISPHSIEDALQDIRRLGTATGTGITADRLAANLSARLSSALPCPVPFGRPTVAHVVWYDPLYVSGNDTLQDDLIVHAGGRNVFADKSGWGTVSLEEFLMKNPDVILVNGGNGMDAKTNDVILDAFMNNPQYASLSAVRNHRVYAVDADILSRPAPRIVDATGQVARLLHPACFTNTTTTPAVTPITTVKSPGFCAGSVVLLISLIMFLHGERSN